MGLGEHVWNYPSPGKLGGNCFCKGQLVLAMSIAEVNLQSYISSILKVSPTLHGKELETPQPKVAHKLEA